jgi:hypothetical protein
MLNGEKRPWPLGHTAARLSRIAPWSANTGVVLGGTSALIVLDLDACKQSSDPEQWAFIRDVLLLLRNDRLWYRLRDGLLRLRHPASIAMLLRCNIPHAKDQSFGSARRGGAFGARPAPHCRWLAPSVTEGLSGPWFWLRQRSPWKVPVADLPVIAASDLEALMRRIADCRRARRVSR